MFSNESSGYATVSFGMMAIRHGLDVSSVVSAAGYTACGRNGVEECRAFVAPDDEVRGKKEEGRLRGVVPDNGGGRVILLPN